MKKFLILIFFLIETSVSCFSQSVKGNFTIPLTDKYIVLKFDCSETVFEKKYNETDWGLIVGVEEWTKAKREALARIVGMMNDKMKKTRIIMVVEDPSSTISTLKSNYTLYIAPSALNRKGKNKSNFILKENATGKVLGYTSVSGGGGHYGSLGNLLGDGYEDSAPDVAKLIAKYNKKVADAEKQNQTSIVELIKIENEEQFVDKITSTPCNAILGFENEKQIKVAILSVDPKKGNITYRYLNESNECVGNDLIMSIKKIKGIFIIE